MTIKSEKSVPKVLYEDKHKTYDSMLVKLYSQLKIPKEEPKFSKRHIYTIPEEESVDIEVTIPEKYRVLII
jgi:hypothetical protein